MAVEAGEGRVTLVGAVVVCQVPEGRVFHGGWSSTALTRLICPTPGPCGREERGGRLCLSRRP